MQVVNIKRETDSVFSVPCPPPFLTGWLLFGALPVTFLTGWLLFFTKFLRKCYVLCYDLRKCYENFTIYVTVYENVMKILRFTWIIYESKWENSLFTSKNIERPRRNSEAMYHLHAIVSSIWIIHFQNGFSFDKMIHFYTIRFKMTSIYRISHSFYRFCIFWQ